MYEMFGHEDTATDFEESLFFIYLSNGSLNKKGRERLS